MVQPTVSTSLSWRGGKVQRDIEAGMGTRVKLAAQLLRDQTVRNLSKPVLKLRTPRGVRVDPDSRSKPGEFPRADTTRLMKDVFWEQTGPMEAIVGTTLDYGLLLEVHMDRSFLRRTHTEMLPVIRNMLLNGPRLPGQV